ncbi:hypothetical protein RND71_038938 [Anisodus tanguticus]|uniref:Uncharacterized protein n=1 Tax=Anisodus tanguticus TaxID=243964 RepID=A0AAE1R375_9SOLA|nr:hypothetical protein RND71_038938 [Anisodus tanguticus]
MLTTAKGDIERLLIMPSQDLLLPENCSALSAALSVYAAAPDLSAERALALEKVKENLPHLYLTLRRAKKDKEDYYKKATKKVLLIDELTKDQELYTNLKDGNDKLEYQISKKSTALDEMEGAFPFLNEMKVLADSDITRVDEFKSKMIE